MATITGANSTFSIVIPGLFAVPQFLQGYAVDDAFTVSDVQINETMMGVDGRFTGGFVFVPVESSISLLADSPSTQVFDDWYNSMQTIRETLVANAVIELPAIGKKYTLTRGFLIGYKPAPDNRRLLQPVQYRIQWGQVTPELI